MKNQKIILTVAIILIVLVIGGVSWYFISEDDNSDTNLSTLTNVNSVINTNVVVGATDDWFTYSNEDLGIRFEYPKTFGDVTETVYDYTQDTNQTNFTGKAIVLSVPFSEKSTIYSENSTIYIEGVTSDFNQMYIEGYKGNADLTSVCDNPSVIKNESYCINKYVANQNTYDRIYFQAPECSPHFVREVKLNSNNSVYPGIRIYQSFWTDGKWDCGSSAEEFAIVTDSELKRLIDEKQQTDEEKQKMEDFDNLLQSFRFTEPSSN
ncbi:MAG: hypothetical protein WC693_06820 [Patescibacteria group bacterium]|jgi:hypothetical protein